MNRTDATPFSGRLGVSPMFNASAAMGHEPRLLKRRRR